MKLNVRLSGLAGRVSAAAKARIAERVREKQQQRAREPRASDDRHSIPEDRMEP